MQQTTVQIPKDAAQLAALRARREEHSAQIRELADRRQRLVSERFSAQANQNQAMVGELDAQTKELTTRLRRIESEKLAMDDAISAALRQGITDQSEHVM